MRSGETERESGGSGGEKQPVKGGKQWLTQFTYTASVFNLLYMTDYIGKF